MGEWNKQSNCSICFSLVDWEINTELLKDRWCLTFLQSWFHRFFSEAWSILRSSGVKCWWFLVIFFCVSQFFFVVSTFSFWKVAALDLSLWISSFKHRLRCHAKSSGCFFFFLSLTKNWKNILEIVYL